nr:MAG: putative RNA-dependent RNA polymerase [Picobirnavirus sp.]
MKVKFNKFPSEVSKVISVNNSAKMALSRLENGTKETQRTWFYEKRTAEEILAPIVAKLEDMASRGENPSLDTVAQELYSAVSESRANRAAALADIAVFDLSKKDKFKPQGETAPFEERLEHFEEYFEHLETPPMLKDKEDLAYWKDAKKMARHLLGFNKTGRPLTVQEVVERGISDQKYNTNSGYPLFMKRKRPEAIAQAVSAAEGNRAVLERYPFMVGSRAQMGKVGKDARFIFMAPMAVNICGQRYAQPVQEYLTALAERQLSHPRRMSKSIPFGTSDSETITAFFTPWLGWDKVQEVISHHWYDSDLRFGADYSKMDQHFNVHHAMEVFDVIKYFFAEEHWSELREMMKYPFTAPIITSKGYVDQEHALLSGSEWTNLIETVWNFIFLLYLYIRCENNYFKIGKIIPMGIGDDQLWLIVWANKEPSESDKRFNRRESFRDDVIEYFARAGLPGNPDKQEGVDNPDASGFLQRHMETGYDGPDGNTPAAGVYSLIRNVTSQTFPERYHNDEEYDWKAFAIRVIMIAENCCKHPLFKWYVTDYIAKANANILRFVRLTDSEIDAKWNAVKNMAGFRPNYNQEKQDKPLTQFETFKLLRTLVK